MRRGRSNSEDGSVKSKETQERNKLRLVAKKMKSSSSSRTNHNSNKNQKDPKRDGLGNSLAALNQQSSHTKSVKSDTSETSLTSRSSSFHGSLGRDNIDCSLNGSLSSIHSDISSVYCCLEGDREDDLDCNLLLYITKFWGKVKRINGYAEDMAESIICHLLKVHPNVRRDIRLKSFRSKRFFELARIITDTIDVLVTMLGPDIDDAELKEIGQELVNEGLQPKLFGVTIALALRELLGEQEFPDKAFDAWDRAFSYVGRRMET
eukprot:scaffold2028_cov191-Amphora_coffeaeformis.AAC.3